MTGILHVEKNEGNLCKWLVVKELMRNINIYYPTFTNQGPVSRIVNYESFLIDDFLNLRTSQLRETEK